MNPRPGPCRSLWAAPGALALRCACVPRLRCRSARAALPAPAVALLCCRWAGPGLVGASLVSLGGRGLPAWGLAPVGRCVPRLGLPPPAPRFSRSGPVSSGPLAAPRPSVALAGLARPGRDSRCPYSGLVARVSPGSASVPGLGLCVPGGTIRPGIDGRLPPNGCAPCPSSFANRLPTLCRVRETNFRRNLFHTLFPICCRFSAGLIFRGSTGFPAPVNAFCRE